MVCDPLDSLGDLESLQDILSKPAVDEALRNIRGESFLLAQELASKLLTDFRGVAGAIGDFVTQVEIRRTSIEDHLDSSKKLFDPYYNKPFSELTDFDVFGSIEFMRQVGENLHKQFGLE